MASTSLTDDDAVYLHESVLRGHHIYKRVWSPTIGEVLELLQCSSSCFASHASHAVDKTHLMSTTYQEALPCLKISISALTTASLCVGTLSDTSLEPRPSMQFFSQRKKLRGRPGFEANQILWQSACFQTTISTTLYFCHLVSPLVYMKFAV